MRKKRILALTLTLSLLLTSCGGGAEATTMCLRKTEGMVGIFDDGSKEITPRDGLGLYSGYGVDTSSESYAWIDLDGVKLTKLDEDSDIAITKEGRKLEIEVKSGNLFFNVTEPLADDESMNIRTSTMLVGIRGTCGWVTQDAVALLEGTVEVTAGEQSVTITAGEMAVLTKEGVLEAEPITAASIPAFVWEEIADDEKLREPVLDSSVTEPTEADPMAAYANTLDKITENGKILHTEMIDFEQDGNPELLVIYTAGENEATGTDFVEVSFYRNETEGVSYLGGGRRPWNIEETAKYSLVEYGGRLYLEEHRQTDHGESWNYHFSIAEKDGTKDSWHRMYVSTNYDTGTYYSYGSPEGDEIGSDVNDISGEEYEAIHGQFNTVRVLADTYTPDGKDVTVTSQVLH